MAARKPIDHLCGIEAPKQGCRCYAAVVRAYNGMQVGGAPDADALYAAIQVYRYYHPEVDRGLARETVGHWVRQGRLH